MAAPKPLVYAVPGNWAADAACRGLGHMFEVERHHTQHPSSPAERSRITKAKIICRDCPVLERCEAWAMTSPDPAYLLVAGGMTPGERAARRPQHDH